MATMVLFGDAHDEILLKEQEIACAKRLEGFDVRVIDGKKTDPKEVPRAFDLGLFDVNPVMVLVRNPSRVKGLKNLISDRLDVLVVQYGANLKSLSDLPCSEFKSPRDRSSYSAQFLIDQVSEGGRSLSKELASAVVKRVGTDLGVLRWEALKFCHVGEGELQPKEIINLIAPLSEAENTELSNALVNGNARDFLRECDRLESTTSGDSFMKVRGLLSNQLILMLETSVRSKNGESISQMAREMDLKPYRIEKYILPPARRLGLSRIKSLLSLLADCEMSVYRNTLSPWTKFKAGAVALLI